MSRSNCLACVLISAIAFATSACGSRETPPNSARKGEPQVQASPETKVDVVNLPPADKKSQAVLLLDEFKRLMEEGKFVEAHEVALKARDLDPDSSAAEGAVQISRPRAGGKWEHERDPTAKLPGNTPKEPADNKGDVSPVVIVEPFNVTDSARTDRTKAARRMISTLASKRINLELIDMPFDEAISYLRATTGVTFQIDQNQLKKEGYDPRRAITLSLANVPIRVALTEILGKKLGYVVTDDGIRITTESAARKAGAPRKEDR
jgi:hypothetical protein